MKYYCNPLNIEYRYQFLRKSTDMDAENLYTVYREAADPSLILFKGLYYLFPSMCAGFFTSEDLHGWEFHDFLQEMPVCDYAPDVRALGEYLYFSASRRGVNCDFYRTKDPLHEPFEKIEGTFDFWDPHLFQDDDGRVYFYWGCSNTEPVYGVELDPETMRKKQEPVPLISEQEAVHGFERNGEDHIAPKTEEEIRAQVNFMMQGMGDSQEADGLSKEMLWNILYNSMGNKPYIEGAWMNKYHGKYYLQYAATGTQYNVYNDSVYVGDSPLGPFKLAKNNPYSYKPGGFMTGAGHGSTLEDKEGRYWHTSTMRISKNADMERRIGIWKAGFDEDGELYCDQRYGDWPVAVESEAFAKPEWMLLSYKKEIRVSSGTGADQITDEDARTWWKAKNHEAGQWAEVDLGETYDVRAVQINFADDQIKRKTPAGMNLKVEFHESRGIDQKQATRWKLEGSKDGKEYFIISDKWDADTDYSHDFIVEESGIAARFLRLTIREVPYQAPPCVSGIRVFGKGNGKLPEKTADVAAERIGELDMKVSWKPDMAVGHNVLWGYAPEKLYHSYMVYGKSEVKIRALIKGQPVYVRVDAFNEGGIEEGDVKQV